MESRAVPALPPLMRRWTGPLLVILALLFIAARAGAAPGVLDDAPRGEPDATASLHAPVPGGPSISR